MNIQEYISSGIIEQYVLGLCAAAEEQELDQLRLQHPVLNEAIVRFETELETYLQQQSIAPGAETDEQILKQLTFLQTPVVTLPTSTAAIKTNNWLKWVAAASVVLLLTSAYFNYSLLQTQKEQQAALESAKKNTEAPTLPLADYKILNDPRITPVAMYGVGSHSICRCTLFWDKKTGKAYMIIHHLPQSSDQQDYQLWAMINGKPVSVGIINDGIRGRFIELTNVPADATAFAVTLEKAGGNTTPTLEEMYLMGKI
jgi:anti-sigma-K factor RskA